MMVTKLEALKEKGTKTPIKKGNTILYLGASHGTTATQISDIVGEKGFVFCIESSPDVTKKLLEACKKKKNMAPLLFDAKHPENYKNRITKADIIYQDITQKDQIKIFLKNTEMFLKKKGYAILALKTKSINSIKEKEEVLKETKKQLKLRIISITDLEPYHKDHYMIICKK